LFFVLLVWFYAHGFLFFGRRIGAISASFAGFIFALLGDRGRWWP
jgi:uncharacterized membrane protein